MGRKFKRNIYDKKGKQDKPRTHSNYEDLELKNENFERYYKEQSILSDEEFQQFMDLLKVPLPTSFRFTGSRSHAVDLKDLMVKEYFPSMQDYEIDGEKIEVPKPISWYPGELGWVSTISRTALRKSPEMSKFHKFLVAETEVGNINRQEVVSMIPVQFMDVKPNHAVLDMCAAPGSKTVQILEAIHANEEDVLPQGMLIANDADPARSHMLVKQTKRLNSPCLMVTNHEAQLFPSIYFAPKGTGAKALQFDRILADVPCSGDGTFRKNKSIWKTWHQRNGNGLHRIQLSILKRGCALLKVGGRIIYSTCSFNPVENEAVVAAMINATEGAFRLVDVSSDLPALIRRPGLSSWKVQNKSGDWFTAWDELSNEERMSFILTLFSFRELTSRSMRLYPFLQNTGGFFVAVLEKVGIYGALDRYGSNHSDVPGCDIDEERQDTQTEEDVRPIHEIVTNGHAAEKIDETVTDGDAAENIDKIVANGDAADDSSAHGRKRSADDGASDDRESKRLRNDEQASSESVAQPKNELAWSGHESPFIFLNKNNSELVAMRDFFGLSDQFPQENFVIRSENENYKTVYFVSSAIKDIFTATNTSRLNIVNTGVRIFMRNAMNETAAAAPCSFRLSNEGLSTIGPFISDKRIVQLTLSDVRTLLSLEYPKFIVFSEDAKSKLTEMRACIVKFDPATDPACQGSMKAPVLLPVWRAQVSVSLLLNKAERKSMMHRLTGEDLDMITGLEKKNAVKEDEGEQPK